MSSKRNRKKRKSPNRPTPGRILRDELNYRYTKGGEFTTITGQDYVGEYHIKASDGLPYTGPTENIQGQSIDKAIKLLPHYKNNNNFVYDRLSKFYTPLKDYIEPTPYQYEPIIEAGVYELGFDTRYFVQKIGKGSYAIEISAEQRELYGVEDGIDHNIYRLGEVQWQLVGTIEAVEKINKERVNIAAQTIPDLPFVIQNYTQFIRPTQQTEFGNPDALLAKNRKFLDGPKTPIRKTYDPDTNTIIPINPS